jgi:phenylacetate-CoA ligase
MHVDEGFAAVEFLPLPQGGFRVVGTNFTNPATPLVRYAVGDVVDYVEGDTCDCGRAGRIVRRVDGRQEDYVILRNGARLGRLDHVFKDLMAIREAQIYQEEPGELIVRVVKNADYTADDEADLLREFRKRVGDEADVRVEYVDRIDRTEAGKIRFVISKIGAGKLVPQLCSAENAAIDSRSQN